jgi:hypothetical protein
MLRQSKLRGEELVTAMTKSIGICLALGLIAVSSGCKKGGGSVPIAPPTPPSQVAVERPAELEAASTPSLSEETPSAAESADLPSNPPETSDEPAAASRAPGELWHDSFADVAGAIRWNKDGVKSSECPPSNRTIYFFNGPPEGGPLVMRVVEDNVATGPDGQPGVLAFSWQELPPKLPYSGITFLGGRASEDRLTLPPLQAAKTVDDLRPLRLKFRHKAVNENRAEPFNLTVGCRLEPMLPDSYAKRVDLGNFTATGEWGSFDMSLGEGTNHEGLLAAIAAENPTSFKIVWAQAGPLTNYQSGDTLLIDDVIITTGISE